MSCFRGRGGHKQNKKLFVWGFTCFLKVSFDDVAVFMNEFFEPEGSLLRPKATALSTLAIH